MGLSVNVYDTTDMDGMTEVTNSEGYVVILPWSMDMTDPDPTTTPDPDEEDPKPTFPTDHDKGWKILGDVDHSGEVDNRDAVLVMQYTLGTIGEDALDVTVANVCDTTNPVVDNDDAIVMMKYVLGQIHSLPQNG